ncbi:MAG TPA: aldo/keto reductase [Chromatiaceae bacterium]|nr:aldo/keto reductase [Chromatiaceae bacterium]
MIDVQYSQLGNSGLMLSTIGLGTHYTLGDRLDFQESRKIVQAALSIGLNYIDTSNGYGKGEAETFLGNILKEIHHSEYCLSTKVFFPIFNGPNGCGLSKKHITDSVEQSLRRLRVEYIDILLLHRFDERIPIWETAEVIQNLVHQGKVLYVGVSNWSIAQIKQIESFGIRIICNQMPYNVLYSKHLETIQDGIDLGVGAILYGVLGQGIISEEYLSRTQNKNSRKHHPVASKYLFHDTKLDRDKIMKIQDICSKINISLFQFTLMKSMLNIQPSSILLGAYQLKHIENIKNFYGKFNCIREGILNETPCNL